MKRIIKSLAIALSMLTAISARADIPEATLAKLFGSPYVKVERRGSVITRITFSKFEDHNFHGGECYSLILEVLRGSDGAELNGDSIPGVTIVDTHEIISECRFGRIARPDAKFTGLEISDSRSLATERR
jgi:hypothetical protein